MKPSRGQYRSDSQNQTQKGLCDCCVPACKSLYACQSKRPFKWTLGGQLMNRLWGLVHIMRGTSDHVSDVAEVNALQHGEESSAFGDAGHQSANKRADVKADLSRHIVMRPGKRWALNKDNGANALIDQAEKLKASIRAKVQHPFRIIKRQF